MFKKILKISLIVSALFFAGCGGGDSANENTPASKEMETLAKSLALQGIMTKQVSQGKNTQRNDFSRALKQTREKFSDGCTNGGTMTVENNFDFSQFENINMENFDPNDLNLTLTMSFENCIEDDITTNGTMQIETETKNQKMTTTMKYLTDFTVEESDESFKILKNSILVNEMVSQTKFISTQSIVALYNDERYETRDLKTAMLMGNNSFGFYPISGEEIINGKSFKVDESYDASKTPMMIDDRGSIEKGGKSKYTDSKNNHITVEATAKDEITISIDTNGDGKADETEVVRL